MCKGEKALNLDPDEPSTLFVQSLQQCLHSSSPYKALAQEVSADFVYSPVLARETSKTALKPIMKRSSSLNADDMAESVRSGKTSKTNITWENDIVEYTRDTEFTETCLNDGVNHRDGVDGHVVKRTPSFAMGNEKFVRAEDVVIEDDPAEATRDCSPINLTRVQLVGRHDEVDPSTDDAQDSPMIEVAQLRNILKSVEEGNVEEGNEAVENGQSLEMEKRTRGKDSPFPFETIGHTSASAGHDSDGEMTPMTPIFR